MPLAVKGKGMHFRSILPRVGTAATTISSKKLAREFRGFCLLIRYQFLASDQSFDFLLPACLDFFSSFFIRAGTGTFLSKQTKLALRVASMNKW